MDSKDSMSMYELRGYLKSYKSPLKKHRKRTRIVLIIMICLATLPFLFFAIWSLFSHIGEADKIIVHSTNIIKIVA